jgi:hypothetical protein
MQNEERRVTHAIGAAAAEAFAKILNETRGAPRARAWIPTREGTLPRVYIGPDGYVEVMRLQILLREAELRAQGGFRRRGLYPSQRVPFDQAVKAYREHYVPAVMAKINADLAAAYAARRAAVFSAVEAGARTMTEIAERTGLRLLDEVYPAVIDLHAAQEILARNLGTDREKIIS